MNDQQESKLIEDAVANGVRRAFLEIGIDTSDARSVKEMQRDMAHLRNIRKGSEAIARHSKLYIVTVAILAVGYGLWAGVQQLLHAPVK